RPRPFPEPTPFVVKNGSKMCERFSDDIPGPLSMISTTVWLSSRRVWIAISPPPFKASAALSSRLTHTCASARIAAHGTTFVRKTLGNASVLELVIQHAESASELLMHVNIRSLRALLSRAGTHGFH